MGSRRPDRCGARRWLPSSSPGWRALALAALVVAGLTGVVAGGPERPQVSGSTTVITDVVPASTPDASGFVPVRPGERMLVRGLSILRPDRNLIVVSVVRGPSAREFGTAEVRRWGPDPVWSAVVEVPADARPGRYVVQADDGNRFDRRIFEVVDPRADPTTGATPATVTPDTTASGDTPARTTPTTAPGVRTTTASGTTAPGVRTTTAGPADSGSTAPWLVGGLLLVAGAALVVLVLRR